MKGKLFKIILHKYEFFVVTLNINRAYNFYTTVFPLEIISIENIEVEKMFFKNSSLEVVFAYVKSEWEKVGLLKIAPGGIEFSRNALDVLLEQNEIILTNT